MKSMPRQSFLIMDPEHTNSKVSSGTRDDYNMIRQNRPVVCELCSSSTRMYASSEQECIGREAEDVIDWKETLEEFDHYQNAMRHHKSIRRLAIRDMAALGFPNRRMFHKQSEDEISRFLLSMYTKKSERNKYKDVLDTCTRLLEQTYRQSFTVAANNYKQYGKIPQTADNQQQPDNRSYEVGNDHYDHQYHLFCLQTVSSFCSKTVVLYLKNALKHRKIKAEKLDSMKF